MKPTAIPTASIHASENQSVTSLNAAQMKYCVGGAPIFRLPKRNRFIGAVLLSAVTAILAPFAHATTVTWTNTVPDYFTNAANWDLAAVPGSTDTADIANNGTALYTDQMTNVVKQMLLGGFDGSSGNVIMSGGVLSITNGTPEDGNAFIPGYWNFSSGTFTLNGGTFTVARPSTSSRYFQDSLQPGFGTGASGTIVVNNGTLNILCGLEVGISGDGTLNVNGGTVIANGWFTFGRGLTANQGIGSGTFNLTGGTVYVLKNGGTGDQVGLRLLQLASTATANISGGTLYCSTIGLGNNGAGAGTATLNVSGGTIYLGNGGVQNPNANASQVKSINISGGTFRTVNLLPNANGQGGLSTVSTGGTNWTWNATGLPTVNLTNSPGPGVVTFAPEATRTITLSASWAGPGGMTIAGPGTVIFGVINSYAGSTTVSGGTLQLNASQPASIISGLTVSSGAILALSSAQTSAPLGAALYSGSTLLMNNNAQIVDATLALPSGATLDFNASNTQFFTNNVSGAGSVVSTLGANGIEIVTGNLAHTGSTIISNGIVSIGGTLNSSSAVIVTNTGSLGGSGTIGAPITVASANGPASAHLRIGLSPMNVPGTLTVNDLTLGAGSELDVKLGSSTTVGGGVNDLLVVQGNLTINPNAFVNVLPMQSLAAGTYVIVQYSGTLTGLFTNTVGGLTRYGFSLDYSTPGQIKLNVSGSNANLVWVGTNTTWDVLGTFNWLNGVTRDTFKEGDAVTFDDSATNFSVSLNTTVYPASITFNNNSNYATSGTGSGRISGGTGITKNGNGTVTLLAGVGLANDYTGPVNINGGILKMNGALTLGATNGATTVASGATLDLNGQTPNAEPMILQGTGFGGTNGAINNSSATSPNQSGGPRVIALTGDTTLNASGSRWDIGINSLGAGGGSFAGNGFNLTKIGANDIWMHEVGDLGVGDILVNQGTLGFQYTIGMGNPAKTITVNPGASLGIFHAATPLSKQIILTNGAAINSSGDAGTSNVLTGPITLYGTNTINNNALPLALPGIISGTGAFQKTGVGPLYLSAANTYSGVTLINGGSLILAASGSIANSSLISVATNAVLDASLPGGLNLGSGKTLSGSGSVIGNVSAGSGSQIAPGTATAAGTLTFSNNVTLNGATNTFKLSGDPFTVGSGVNDLIVVTGNLTASGVSTIQVSPLGILSSGVPYTVMQYSGTTPSAANFQVISTSTRYTPTLVDPATTPGSIQVTIAGNPGLLVWKGGAATNANIWNNSTTNWQNLSTGLRDVYLAGDNAILDDSGLTNLVNLAATAAGLISLSNNTTPYTLTGNGLITAALDMEGTGSFRLAVSNPPAFSSITANSGTLIFDVQGVAAYTNAAPISDNFAGQGTLLKAGTNLLVLSADNSLYTGAILITNGVLQYTNAKALGSAPSPLYVTNNGTLDLNGIDPLSKNINIAGNGYNGKGALISSSANGLVNNGTRNLTLTGDASIAAVSRWDIVGSIFNANGHSLTVLGPGATLIELVGDGTLADIHVVGGRLGFQGATSMGDPTRTCTIESNAVLTFFNAGTQTKNLVLNGNATIDSGGTATTFNGPITLAGTNNLFGLRVDFHVESGVGGAGSLVAGNSPVGAGSGNLYLDANNTYTGTTTINSGHAIIIGAGSSLASSLILVNGGGTLDVSAPTSFTLGAGQTLIGNGTVTGTVVVASGATLAAGLPDNNTYILTMNGTLTFQPGSTNVVVVSKGATVANDTVAGLTSVTMAGTLVINNVGNPLAGGDAIQLFSASSGYGGNFANIIPAVPAPNLTWDTSTLNTDGKLRVLGNGPPTNPTNIVVSVSGNQLTLSWPANYTGWTLQGQTNGPGVGLTTNWQDVPGSTTTNNVILPINPADGSSFFRMILK